MSEGSTWVRDIVHGRQPWNAHPIFIDVPQMYSDFVAELRGREPVSFSRWGDGEMDCVYNTKRLHYHGCLSHSPYWCERLRSILESGPDYRLGLQPLAIRLRGAQIVKDFPAIPWVYSDFLHNASQDVGLEEMFEALTGLDVILVGPEYMTKLRDRFDFQHVVIPSQRCWNEYERVLGECRAAIAARDPDNFTVVLFAASALSNVLVDDLHRESSGRKISLLDCGSVFEPYIGMSIRKYHPLVLQRLNS